MFAQMQQLREGLARRYAEPHRHYHNLSHIQALLDAAADARLHQPAMVEAAIWYHDAIYDPARRDNEDASAALLEAELAGLADPALIGRAALLVRATAGHALPADLPPELAEDAGWFLDADLAILAAAPAAYDRYAAGIMAEYAPLHAAAALRQGRADFLRGMLARPRLFLTDAAHAARDAAARANLARELAGLMT